MQPEIPFPPVFSSMKRLIRYSLGSVALGSLILSFVESIRFMLESIRRKLKVAGTSPDNWFGKVAFHISRFCLRCIDWTIRSVNRNAYIMVSWEIVLIFIVAGVEHSWVHFCIFRITNIASYYNPRRKCSHITTSYLYARDQYVQLFFIT